MAEPGSIGGTWYCDGWDPDQRILHRLRGSLFADRSPYQQVEVCDTPQFGRMLVIDGLPQAAERDEAIYAKAITWPALLGVPGPKRVLVTGGGDGHVLREALRFGSVVATVVCDIDPLVTRATQEFMPFLWGGAHRDRRAEIRHEDAREYLRQRPPASFEVVVSDITDPTGEGTASHHLYSPEYFNLIRRCLVEGGVCVVQAQELSVKDWGGHRRLRGLVAAVFPVVRSAQVYVPSFGYPEGLVFASDRPAALHLDSATVEARLREAGLQGDPDFDAAVYGALFVLPPRLRTELGQA